MKRKKLLSIVLCAQAIAAAAAFSGCASKTEPTRPSEPEFYAYEFSDVVMIQTGINSYDFEFSADCADDDVDVYLTMRDKIRPTDSPLHVTRSDDGSAPRFKFSATLNLSDEYYLWLNGENKQGMLPLTIPSMFPSMDINQEGAALFSFNYTYGVSWSSFCDPEGKAVWMSDKSVYDETAELVEDNILITMGECVIPKSKYDASKYYYSVTTAKNGLLTIVSVPVVVGESVASGISSMSADLGDFGDGPNLEVKVGIKQDSELSREQAKYLQLVVKSDTGAEIYVCDAEYANGTAVMSFDCRNLMIEGKWYDLVLAWRGAVITDVPKKFGGKDVIGGGSVIGEGDYVYSLPEWKGDGQPDDAAVLKVVFKEDKTRYAEEFCSSYLVSIDTNGGAKLVVDVVLKDNVYVPPELIITADSETPLGSCAGEKTGDNSYSYSLALGNVLTVSGTWYDIRFMFGSTLTEFTKDECISSADFGKSYDDGNRVYKFAEWDGLLKVYF